MNNYAQKMKKCKTEEDITKASVESLHAAVSGLKGLSAMMKKSATFWEMVIHIQNSMCVCCTQFTTVQIIALK